MTWCTRFLLMVLAVVVVCLTVSAGCVSEPPVPEGGGYFITIDPIADQILGTTFVVSGTTNLTSGSKLLYEQVWDDWRDSTADQYPSPGAGVFSATGRISEGFSGINVWQYTINSSTFLYPKTYLLRAGAVNDNISVSSETTYNITRPDGSMITPAPTPLPTPRLDRTAPVPEPGETFVLPIPSPTLTPPPPAFADDGTPLYTRFAVREHIFTVIVW